MNDFTAAVTSFFAVGRSVGFTLEESGPPLGADDAAAVRTVAAEAEASDGIAPLSEQPMLWLEDPAAPVRHVVARSSVARPSGARTPGARTSGGQPGPRAPEVLAYAQLDVGGGPQSPVGAELVVRPAARRRGIGLALLARAQHVAEARGRTLALWAHGDLPGARHLARSAGLRVVRELELLGRRLPPGPVTCDAWLEAGLAPGPAPEGVTLRAMRPGADDDAWVRLNARVFADHPEQGRVSRSDLAARMAEDWFDPDGFLLAWRADEDGGERLVGYCWTKLPPATPTVGEIYVLGVDASEQGHGVGHWLLREGLAHLARRGATDVELYVDGDNAPALATYAAAGFERRAVHVQLSPA